MSFSQSACLLTCHVIFPFVCALLSANTELMGLLMPGLEPLELQAKRKLFSVVGCMSCFIAGMDSALIHVYSSL